MKPSVHLAMIYHDSRTIYLEFRPQNTDPYVLKFEKTEGGLAKALKVIPKIETYPGYQPVAEKVMAKKILVARKGKPKDKPAVQVGKAEATKVLDQLGLKRKTQ